ncbi:hypothetical protein [Roseateles aquatilis]|nr:hypothetical protein [Roseateles aquatilis]
MTVMTAEFFESLETTSVGASPIRPNPSPSPGFAGSPPEPPGPEMTEVEHDLLNHRPLRRMSADQFEEFLYRARMYPTFSRFAPGNAEFFAPRRDVSVAMALATLRKRIEHAVAIAEMVARLERAHVDDDSRLDDDDEAVIAVSGIRDDLREALGMLGVVEQALRDGRAALKILTRVG